MKEGVSGGTGAERCRNRAERAETARGGPGGVPGKAPPSALRCAAPPPACYPPLAAPGVRAAASRQALCSPSVSHPLMN